MNDLNKFRTNIIPLLDKLNEIKNNPQNKSLFRKEPIDQVENESSWHFRNKKGKKVNYENVAYFMRSLSANSKEYANFIGALHDIPLISKHFIKAGKIRCNYESIYDYLIVQNILQIYIKKNNNFSRNTRLIRSIYGKIIKHFCRKYNETEYRIYLENLEFESNTIKITDDIKIQSLSPASIESLYNNDGIFRKFYSGKWLLDMSKVQSMAVCIKRESKTNRAIVKSAKPEYQEIEEEFDKLINSLRCVSIHQLNRSPIIMEVKTYPFFNRKEPIGDNNWHNYQNINHYAKNMNIKVRELCKFIDSACAKYDELTNIFRRLGLRDIKYNFEDMVIDLFICFEFLVRIFLPKKCHLHSPKELIALLIPAFIYTNQKDRENSYKVIREGYNIRSRIVHADKPKQDEYQTIKDAEKIFKEALFKAVIYYNKIPRKDPHEWLINLNRINKLII